MCRIEQDILLHFMLELQIVNFHSKISGVTFMIEFSKRCLLIYLVDGGDVILFQHHTFQIEIFVLVN